MTAKQKQCLLAYLGYYTGAIDGIWGEKSRQATEDFQRSCGLDPDGVFGEETARRIREEYDRYDGFVITHGTDTMAYAAALLYYLIQNNRKPVVPTRAHGGTISNTSAGVTPTSAVPAESAAGFRWSRRKSSCVWRTGCGSTSARP